MKLIHDQLILAAGGIDAEPAPGDDLLSLAWVAAQPEGNTAPDDGPKLGFGILQRQVNVSRRGPRKVGHFACRPDGRKAVFNEPFDFARQFADGQDLDAFGHEKRSHEFKPYPVKDKICKIQIAKGKFRNTLAA